MSCNYADGLSPYHDKGQLGLEEKFDSKSVVCAKVSLLTKWINEAKHVVIHTGAGISTSAGIPDFRGPKGVWTLQAKGEKPDLSKDFNEAIPTATHMAIMKLVEKQKVKYVVSQNIDGLHLRSNLQRKYSSELHGNMFTEQCNSCNRQFVRSSPVPTVGQKSLNKTCPATKANGRPCRGRLHDTILDWEHNLPENDLGMADYHSCLADLSISLGTTMQIVPSGNLPLYTKRHGGKLVIVNLQPTKHDRKANLLIHAYVDDVMAMLMKNLGMKIPKYAAKNDPTRTLSASSEKYLEWTISDYALKKMKKIYEEKCGSKEARKRLEMIYDDVPLSIAKNLKRKVKEDEDSDLEVLDVIVKPKKGRESSRRGSKKKSTPVYNTTITIKKVTPPPKKPKYEEEKITIKKNVTPTKTKYEIVTKPKKATKCEIVYNTESDLCNDLDMICESDDDEMTNNFTYNFKMYLHDDSKKNVKVDVNESQKEIKAEIKDEIKVEKDMKQEKEESVEQKKTSDADGETEAKVEKKNITKTETPEGGAQENSEEVQEGGNEESCKREETISHRENNNIEEVLIEDDNENISEVNIQEQTSDNEKESEENESIAEISLAQGEPGKQGDEMETSIEETQAIENPLATDKEIEDNQKEKEMNETTSDELITKSSENIENESEKEVEAEKASQPERVETMHEEELENLISTTSKEDSKDPNNQPQHEDKADADNKPENNYSNMESELSNLTDANLGSSVNQMANQADSNQFNTSLEMATCNDNTAIDFYNNEYNSTNNPTDFDYVDNNYYNNF